MEIKKCPYYKDEEYTGFVVEYRGDFTGEIAKVDFACGAVLTDSLAVVYARELDLSRVLKEVPSIIFVEALSLYSLQNTSPNDIDNIQKIKINPYLNLNGKGVVVGIIDSGINYLNKEFMREDDTSRIISIWDQSLDSDETSTEYIGKVYTNSEINEAIKVNRLGNDPYSIVQSKDEVGHGTKMAGIIGARGYNKDIEGIANDCEFAVVKLAESYYAKKIMRVNNLQQKPIYNNTEILAGVVHLYKLSRKIRKPIVIYLGVGSTAGSHDGNNITAKFITSITNKSSVVFVAGTGNLGNSEGHTTGYVKSVGDTYVTELVIPKEIEYFNLNIWIQKPNAMSLSITSPLGEIVSFSKPKVLSIDEKKFYLSNTIVRVVEYDPENFTGNQLFNIFFRSIKPGIWKLNLTGDYITNGRYDIWLTEQALMPEGVKFLKPNPYNTLTVPSTAVNVVTVAYYGDENSSAIAESGRGFNTNGLINPDIATVGKNVLTTSVEGTGTDVVSGSSVATSVIAGVCALILQWAVSDKNDITINSTKLRSLLIYSAQREKNGKYPNEENGYGKLDFFALFRILSGNYTRNKKVEKVEYEEYIVNSLYIRVPKDLLADSGGDDDESRI